MLIIFSGLPGSGKSTIAKALATELRGAYIRVDSIEQALLGSGEMMSSPQVSGYLVGYSVAEDCLRSGAVTIADSVNPIRATRIAWLEAARRAGRSALEVGVICSDQIEHRRRVEHRVPDIDGHVQPSWQEVINREFEPWDPDVLAIDTATLAPEAAVATIVAALTHHKL